MSEVLIVPTGIANLASVRAGFDRLGARVRVAERAEQVASAERVVLPGVGAFGAAMRSLTAAGFAPALRDRFRAARPTLAVCVGLQLLLEGSEESPGVEGLGVVPGIARRLEGPKPVPQLGWNAVEPTRDGRFVDHGWAYFAHSYALSEAPPGWSAAFTDYGGQFVAAMERGGSVACQFHPELSGAYGGSVVERWLSGAAEVLGAHRERHAGDGSAVRVIPCLDARDGRVVKGVKFQGLRDAGAPAELAARYEADGADELVVLDVSATAEGRRTALDTVRKVRACLSIPLTVGGGVRAVDDARRLLDAGADKVSINTAAVREPDLLAEMAAQFGRQCTVLSIDAAMIDGRYEVRVASGREGTGLDAVDWARRGVELGAGELLLTSWDRDGTREGYDLGLVGSMTRALDVPVIASGGASSPRHLAEAARCGATGVLAASIFHYGEHTVTSTKQYLRDHGVAVRP